MTRGFTLIEMTVTVLILGLLTGLSGLAMRSVTATQEQGLLRELAEARSQAIRSGRPVFWIGDSVVVRFLPNGSCSGGRITQGGGTWIVEPLTGTVREAQ